MRKPLLLLTLTACLSTVACAGLVIRTWIIDANMDALVRRDSHGSVIEKKALRDADGFRCYSRSDDEAWRADYAQCRASCK